MDGEYGGEHEHIDNQRKKDLAFAHTFPALESARIGKLLGKGWVHSVYEYADRDGKQKVVKLPMYRNSLVTTSALEKMLQYEQSKLFQPFIVPTQIESSPHHDLYAYVQDRLPHIKPLSPHNIDRVMPDFQRLLALNKISVAHHGKCLDFLGGEGLTICIKSLYDGNSDVPELSNLVVQTMPDGSAQLKIIDIDLIHMDARADTRFMPNLLSVREKAMYGLNRIFLKKFYGIDIGI